MASRLTSEQRAIDWAVKALGIADWEIKLTVADDRPGWTSVGELGACSTNPGYKYARVWICPKAIKANGDSNIATLFHELLHIVGRDVGIENGRQNDRMEFAWNKIADIMVTAYTKGR